MSTCCCVCPYNRTDWVSTPHFGTGLLWCNLSFVNDTTHHAASWHARGRYIIVPGLETRLSCWTLLIPFACVLLAIPKASSNAFILFEEHGQMVLEHREMLYCSQVTHFKKINVVEAVLLRRHVSLIHGDDLAVEFKVADGTSVTTEYVKEKWLGDDREPSVRSLVNYVNAKILDIKNQASLKESAKNPVAHGHDVEMSGLR